jgi:DedD protein
VNSLLHREGDDDLDQRNGRQDREITLGTTVILGIFLALAVLCAIFFGFGYSTGRKSVVTSAPAPPDAQNGNTFAGFKPAAGNPVGGSSGKPGQTLTVPYDSTSTPGPSSGQAAVRPAAAAPEQSPDDSSAAEPSPAPAARPLPSPPVTPSSALAGGAAVVQIAAVTHQEDADLLITTLKRRGYNVAVHSEPQDKLLHVQVGPFASHKDADAMRQRLLADGFNAIVKDAK